jgi:hypothetical protein
MTKSRRSSSPNMSNGYTYASTYLYGSVLRVAGRSIAEEAQRKIDERHAKQLAPESKPGNRKYPLETINEIKAMHAAGVPPRDLVKMFPDIPYSAIQSIVHNTADGLSAARAKGYYKR